MNESDIRPVSAAEIETMVEEIRRGLRSHESRVHMTPAHREVWDDLVEQHG